MSNKLVQVKGKSLKGKNRIREHGDTFKVIQEHEDRFLVESLKNSDYTRTIFLKNDEHMDIISVVERD